MVSSKVATDEDGRLITVNKELINCHFKIILLSTLLKCRVRSEWGVARICHVTL